mmetsp:Transcript_26336/g.44947  ORF Transcript_26336/g.44947 Transcript_26336/m.44947 type:complete len:435 (-) Transcript_26336:280-1584(-)
MVSLYRIRLFAIAICIGETSAFSASSIIAIGAPSRKIARASHPSSTPRAPAPARISPIAIATSRNCDAKRCGVLKSLATTRRGSSSTRLQSAASSSIHSSTSNNSFPVRKERTLSSIQTLLRVLLPASLSGILAFLALPTLCGKIATFVLRVTDPARMGMLSEAVSSFIGLVGILYSILVGQVFGFLYSQQEALYYALFDEVTEAKSLLEQVALVSQGRTMYSTCLESIARYVKDDLLGGTLTTLPSENGSSNGSSKKGNKKDPSTPSLTPSLILSARPADDPLEAILYLTSVGIPGQVYDTVRSLRQARARRLGALQRKVPVIHLLMLWILGAILLAGFPTLVGVGSAAVAMNGGTIGGPSVLTLQGGLFGLATFALVMTKMVLGELWRTKGGAYNVDGVLKVMVRGLQKELEERMVEAKKIMKRKKKSPKEE